MEICLKNGIKPKGTVKLPPSKSEAIRAALLLALAGEDPRRAVEGYEPPFCGDIECALSAFREDVPFVGGSAALLRMLLPVLLVKNGSAEIRTERRLAERGVGELENCLGIRAEIRGETLKMRGFPDRTRFRIDCSRSSQFLSGLLIALPLIGRECEIEIINGLVSKPYADMTLHFVRLFGGRAEETANGYVTMPSRYRAPDFIPVTGDESYAAVFRAMNLLGGDIIIEGSSENTLQPDRAFDRLAGLSVCDIADRPDLMPLLAVTACGRNGDTVIRSTARLRTKESDRESGIVRLIRDLGGSAEVGENSVTVHGTGKLKGGIADPGNDHRLAFAAAVAAVISEGPVTVLGAECVCKSAPGFWDDIKVLGIR